MSRTLQRLAETAAQNALLPSLILLLVASLCIDGFSLLYQPSYTIGDWLINYSHGFIRRGLPGQALLILSRLTHIPVPWCAFIVPAIIYSFFLFGIYRLANPLARSFLWFALLFSPAALPFIVLNGVDIAYRKETLILASLVMVVLLLQEGASGLLLGVSLCVLFTGLVLSHEAMIVCLPYFFAAVAIQTRQIKQAFKICLVPFLLASFLLVLVSRHPGDQAFAQGICSSVGGRWLGPETGSGLPGMQKQYSLCSGSIWWLSVPLSGYHKQIQQLNSTAVYAPRFLMASLPFAWALWLLYRERLRFEVRVIGWTALVCFLGSLGLFYSAIDWGRWIYMQDICLLLVILMAAQKAPGFRRPEKAATPGSVTGWSMLPVALLTAVYCTCWTLPTNGLYPLRRGYLQTARFTKVLVRDRLRWNAEHNVGPYGEPIDP